MLVEASPSKRSHRLVKNAYDLFRERIDAGWDAAGVPKKAFEWAVHLTRALQDHMVLVTVVSTNEKSAASIFATLNDRGIGLSTVDLIRSFILQRAVESHREEIIECWDTMFTACGTNLGAETLIRMSWVSEHGDVKTRALYKIVADSLDAADTTPLMYSRRLRDDGLLYKRFREGDSDDGDEQADLRALRTLRFNASYPLLFAAHHRLSNEDVKELTRALVAIAVRHNVICNLDRARLESVVYEAAHRLSAGANLAATLKALRDVSPGDQQFRESFSRLSFSIPEHGIVRYLLQSMDARMAKTSEVTVPGADRVHVEHIYPQSPLDGQRWTEHETFLTRIGNLTLLDKKLNESIKNADFATKKEKGYKDSRLEITRALLSLDSWSHEAVVARQEKLCALANKIWPINLV